MQQMYSTLGIETSILSSRMGDIYFNHFGEIPNSIEIRHKIDFNEFEIYAKKINACLKKYSMYEHLYDYNKKTDSEANCAIIDSEGLLILIKYNIIAFYYTNTKPDKHIEEFKKEKYLRKEINTKFISVIIPTKEGFNTQHHILKRTTFIPENYNDDLITIHEFIVKSLSKNRTGIYLFHGQPGTGKSSYISMLTNVNCNKSFIYLPSYLLESLDSPALMNIFLDNKNSIFVIEDGEKLLDNRDNNKNSPISALLNISDGLLGQILDCQIICTFNTELKNIDKALMRKGRLICMHEFTKLKKDKAINLAKKLEYDENIINSINEDMTLAEVYNLKEENYEINKRKKIGFGK